MPLVAAVAVPHPPMIVPAVGRGREREVQATIDAYREAMAYLADEKPDTIVITSPHAELYADWFHISPGDASRGDFGNFGAPGVVIRAQYDTALAAEIEKQAGREDIPAGRAGQQSPGLDHGTAVPLYYLDEVYKKYKVVRMGLAGFSLLDHYRMGQCIGKVAAKSGKRIAFLASGDLSHRLKSEGPYDYAPEGPLLDKEVTEALADGDFGRLLAIDPAFADKAGECGLRSFVMMAGALDGRAVQSRLLSYEGPFGVGYAVATFGPGAPDEGRRFGEVFASKERVTQRERRRDEDAYIQLARQSVECYVRTGEAGALPEGLVDELTQRRAGVFVSLHRYGELRGCIGTIAPVQQSVAAEIWRNAVSAAAEDPRFAPVGEAELDMLDISVDVLGPAEAVESEAALDPARYGVIVSSGIRRGLLLPDLAGVDSATQQVDIARRKAGIPEGAPLKLERFEVVRHEAGHGEP